MDEVAALTRSVDDLTGIDPDLPDGPTIVVSGSQRRSFTGALRRAIEVRDRHCQHSSGCEVQADLCDVDHIVPFSQGGVTEQFDGRFQCPTHHRRSDFHDHETRPPPHRDVGYLDILRARIRWRVRHSSDGDDPDPA